VEAGKRLSTLKSVADGLAPASRHEIDLTLRQFGVAGVEKTYGDSYEYVLDRLESAEDATLTALATYVGSTRSSRVEDADDLWDTDTFRLFASHINGRKGYVTKVKRRLARLGIDVFVAHADIQPTKAWEQEIRRALASCDALAAFLHKGFHDSKWTDQEVGFCIGRDVPILPVAIDEMPYGLMARFQAIKVSPGTATEKIGSRIFHALASRPETSSQVALALAHRFARSESFQMANRRRLEPTAPASDR
jgi:TIR domain